MLHWMRDKFSSSRQRFSRILNRRNDSREPVYYNKLDTSKMLVSDTILPDDYIKLRVVGIEGDVWTVETTTNLTVSNLITMVLGHFFNTVDRSKIESNYSLISVTLKRELNFESTIQEEGLSDYDEILLIERYTPKPPALDRINDTPIEGPGEQEIFAATKHLEARNIKRFPMPEECLDNFQFEIRKVLITLVEASASILSALPNAKQIFQDISSRIEQKMEADEEAIKKIVSLGFTEIQAKHALQLKRNNVNKAVDWLLENGDKVQEDKISENIPGPSRSDIDSEDPILIIIQLLDYFRETRIKNFEPDSDILQGMIEMGYPTEECIAALRITGNSKSSAYEWLIGERKVSIQDIDTGLDTEGSIYKALLKNPTIQFGLHNPKILLAFLGILENPANANIWLNDPDTKPVINQVFKIYHSEKHILLVNRHVEQYQSLS